MPKVPPIGKRFKKGEVSNPDGARRHSIIKRKFRMLTELQLKEVMDCILSTNPDQLGNKQDTILKEWLMAAARTGIRKGDMTPLLAIIDRVIGKVEERIKISKETPLTDEDLKRELDRLRGVVSADEHQRITPSS